MRANFGSATRSADRPRRGCCVEQVRVVQHRRFGGPGGAPVVVGRDGVQQLGSDGCAASRQSVATPTVCSSSPPAYA
jgi:hypothetical protein